ncbi:MerR family transcriptional regulator [Longirhabdus pacifica]|uniref:MerR family transcriptional regulator n=1 Tax=Longirhabdus pacifica TaxID=2305227 RepID=UPI0013E8BCD9|nr:MerR family transcriptional regulator [Longirhabdus pacifica]
MYSMKVVSEKVGIPAMTLRAWERRYGLAPSSRTSGGHRLYSDEDIEKLVWLKTQMDKKGITISQAIHLLQQSGGLHESLSEESSTTSHQYEELGNRLYEALIHFNIAEANDVVEFAYSLYHFERVFHQLFLPVAYRIGDEWEKGKVNIMQEHFATQFLLQRVYKLIDLFTPKPNGARMIALCPEGETHQLGLLFFVLFLRKKGAHVLYLGPDTPMKELHSLLKVEEIHCICVSLSKSESLNKVAHAIKDIYQQFPHLQFALGGKGFRNAKDSQLEHWILRDDLPYWEQWFNERFENMDASLDIKFNDKR